MTERAGTEPNHPWRFFRSGGFDQVRIETAEDLRHLDQLDQKLWAVLGCPTSGLEFDRQTLERIDTDGDGRIRSPEILAAVRWACAHLKDPGILFEAGDALPLDAIDTTHPEGARMAATARQLLAVLGRSEASAIRLVDLAEPTRFFAPERFNGDGIVPAELAEDDAQRQAIADILACCAPLTDRSGQPGIDQATLERFFELAEARARWLAHGREDAAVLPLGDATADAATLFDTLRPRIDDFFTRCRLAAFDARAAEALNPPETAYREIAQQLLSAQGCELATLPLARVSAGAELPLATGLNPAWSEAIARLRDEIVGPLLGPREHLGAEEWSGLSARFDAWHAWMREKPGDELEGLGPERLAQLLDGTLRTTLSSLIERDRTADTAAEAFDQLERLLRYRRDLVTLLKNYVNLSAFYSQREKAIFQAGTLYLDQRSCDLCLRVDDMARHAALAPLSGTYLVYCQCTRADAGPITIVAALTGGDADEMLVPGRNGIFYDRQGRDWNASIVKVVENPISVRQAFWSPYRRIGRMIGEQIRKFAASRDQAVDDKAAANLADTAAGAEKGSAAPAPAGFDIARFAGIFAAIGLALGALGTALAAIVTGLLSMPPWQLPLVVVAVMLLISGPSMLLAWLKLRQRNLGPLLDANGWAVNTRARINLPFGGALTGVAALPPGASRSLDDPYAEKRTPWRGWLLALLTTALLAWLWHQGYFTTGIGAPTVATEPPR